MKTPITPLTATLTVLITICILMTRVEYQKTMAQEKQRVQSPATDIAQKPYSATGYCPVKNGQGMYLPLAFFGICNDILTPGNYEAIDQTGRVESNVFLPKIRVEGWLENKRPTGKWLWYIDPKRVELLINFKSDQLDGKFEYIHPSVDFIILGEFSKGVASGSWLYHLKQSNEVKECTVTFEGPNTVIDQDCMKAIRPFLYPHSLENLKQEKHHNEMAI